MRLYSYIGPKEIADRTASTLGGTVIRSGADLLRWVGDTGQRPGADGCVIATFVIRQDGALLIADRHSEHVACAGRQPVMSAGEITFEVSGPVVEVAAVSNQSTGYCPEPESWPAVAAAIIAAGLEPPPGFALACVFRQCHRCGNINVVKDDVFECAVCEAGLPAAYNCQEARD